MPETSRQSKLEDVLERELEDMPPLNLAAIRAALEAAGVTFTSGTEPGVRLKSANRGKD